MLLGMRRFSRLREGEVSPAALRGYPPASWRGELHAEEPIASDRSGVGDRDLAQAGAWVGDRAERVDGNSRCPAGALGDVGPGIHREGC